MNSKIYKGRVTHHRLLPVKNSFSYPYYFYAFDLDELSGLDKSVRGFGYNRVRIASIHDKDYLTQEKGAIKEKLFSLLAREGVADGIEKVMLVTSAKYFNHIFNPVSFYYCYDKAHEPQCVVAEVNNTFGERYVYILKKPFHENSRYFISSRAEKKFFVSPFFTVEGEYFFYLSDIAEDLDIRINYMREKKIFFTAHLEGRGAPLTSGSIGRTIVSMPLRALLSLPLIHLQAMNLFFLKKLNIIGRPHARGPYVLRQTRERAIDRFFINKFMTVMSAIDIGRLKIHMPDGRTFDFGGGKDGPCAEMTVHNYWFFIKAGLFGDVGFGDCYMEGLWDTPDLPGLLKVFVINMKSIEERLRRLRALNFLSRPRVNKINQNTIGQAKKNIQSHYDLGNDFFKLFLDDRMMYSSAMYETKNESLEEAQLNKIRSLIRKAAITEKDHVLEIGSGWGGFARAAALSTGCRVTTITVSQEQYDYVRRLVEKEGLADRVGVQLCDYREITGRYDKIVSIEMLEAVGHQNIPGFFKKCSSLLKDGGILAVQVITIPDEKYDEYRNSHDWIREHIFPGGMLPSMGIMRASAEKGAGLVITDVEDIADSYAMTLREWRKRLYSNKDGLFKLGFDEVFYRKWDYYLSYSEAALGQRAISDLQIVFKKP